MALSFEAFLQQRGLDKRLARLTHDIALPLAHGLEIGAAANPTPLPEGGSVTYIDHAADAAAGLPGAVSVDHAWSGAGPCPAEREGGYDFAIASQTAQYVPNLLGWLRGLHAVLRPGGVLNLGLPDRRFMFDVKRKPSTTGELIEAFYGDWTRPSPRQVFDHTYGAAAVEPPRLWGEEVAIDDLPRFCGEPALALALEAAARARDGDYVQCHCWVFTPLSFIDVLIDLARLRLLPFVVSQFSDTGAGECEFFVCLRRDAEDDPERLLALQLGALAHVRDMVDRRRRTARRLARD